MLDINETVERKEETTLARRSNTLQSPEEIVYAFTCKKCGGIMHPRSGPKLPSDAPEVPHVFSLLLQGVDSVLNRETAVRTEKAYLGMILSPSSIHSANTKGVFAYDSL